MATSPIVALNRNSYRKRQIVPSNAPRGCKYLPSPITKDNRTGGEPIRCQSASHIRKTSRCKIQGRTEGQLVRKKRKHGPGSTTKCRKYSRVLNDTVWATGRDNRIFVTYTVQNTIKTKRRQELECRKYPFHAAWCSYEECP